MKNHTYKLILLLIISYSYMNAQERVAISKMEAQTAVKENNQTLKMSQEDFIQARADFRQTNAVFLPNITASHTGLSTTNPLMAFGSKLNQGILTASDFNPDLLNNPDAVQNFATKFEIQQPLINMDGFLQRKAAKSKMDAMSLKQERTEDYMVFEVDKAYMQLQLAYKGIEVLEKALLTAEANYKMATDNFNQGYLQKSDLLAVEVRVTEIQNQLQIAKSNVQNGSNYLAFLMDANQDLIYKPTDSLQVENLNDFNDTSVAEDRSDIKAMAMATDAYKTMYQADKMTFLPRLNAFGSYELYDEHIFQAGSNGYVVGAQLSWDILNGTKRFGKAQKSKSEYQKSQLEYEQYVSQSQLELNKAKRMLVDAKNKLVLSKLAMEQSEESLRIRKNRFEQGLEKTTDLLMSETQYAQKQLEYYQTIFEYNYAQSYVQFLTK
ncbi:TolC family protein [Mangrovimonas futianensis]|uniref:TolC family protein n=1 Tax=Mangrovimonas futianensis TaxID=2895523 RepID=UPI001E2A97E7|nr:TolC family protein [Mangrovimonas futianensis]MCF1420333.1 TolC family protein [Mangrovimonas futianensis]